MAFEPFPNAKGSGTRIGQLLRGLVEAGAEVRLLTLPGTRTTSNLPVAVDHRPLRVAEPNYLARALEFRSRVVRELMALRPDVVHFRGHFEGEAALAYASAYPAATVFEINGLPSVELAYHYRALGQAPEFLSRLRQQEQRVLKAVDLVITQSQTTLAFLRTRGLPDSIAVTVIPNGAEVRESASRAARERPEVLYVGTLAPWQGVAELLMAVKRCNRTHPLHLGIAGTARRGWGADLERMLRRLKLADSVTVHGPLDRDQLARQVAGSDICVAPLRRDLRNQSQGCSPIKLYEYMAAGRAVLATDLPCVREIIEHGVTGWLVTPSRPTALADGLLQLGEDRTLRERLGDHARTTIRQGATWEHRRAALRQAYQDLIAPRASAYTLA